MRRANALHRQASAMLAESDKLQEQADAMEHAAERLAQIVDPAISAVMACDFLGEFGCGHDPVVFGSQELSIDELRYEAERIDKARHMRISYWTSDSPTRRISGTLRGMLMDRRVLDNETN